MKRNALIRIIFFSTSLVLMTALLIFGLVRHDRRESRSANIPAVTRPDIVDITILYPRVATADINIRSAPETGAAATGMLLKGDWVDVVREETVDGTAWSYISNPKEGWVLSEYLESGFIPASPEPAPRDPEVREAAATESVTEPAPKTPEVHSFRPDRVRELDIEWVSGTVILRVWDKDPIQVSETGVTDKVGPMICRLKEDTLSIDFSKEKDTFLSVTDTDSRQKQLTVYVPADWSCQSLDLETASADLLAEGLNIGEMDFEGASGTCRFHSCSIDQLEMDTASGDILYTGTLQQLEVDAASANVTAVLSNVPRRLSMASASGNLDITLPKNAGFTLTPEGLSTEFTSDFATWKQGRDHVSGDGSCRILLNVLSGNVVIRKAPEAQ